MAQNQAAKLKALRQSFVTADKDGDSLLNKNEFKEFVEIGYQKKCPPTMYENLCKHFNRDPDIGIDWSTARAVWVQAQSGTSRSKSPPPPHPKQQNGTISNPSNNIKQAFIQCDKDADGFLNKTEFHQFVKTGFKKPSVPDGMYEQVCKHFKKDPKTGIDWLSAFALWKQSNPNNTHSPNAKKKNKTPPPKKLNTRPPQLNRVKTTANVSSKTTLKAKIPPLGQLSVTKSTGQIYKKEKEDSASGSALTEKNLRALDGSPYSKSVGDDETSDVSESYTSQNNSRRHQRAGSIQRRNTSFDDGPDASQMVVQMMETKVKNLQNQLKLERAKRKKTEELAQSLLTSNEEYKKQIGDLSTTSTKLKTENKTLKEHLSKMKQIVDDDRNTIKHLKEQRTSKKNERDEAYALIGKIEEKYETTLKKERHKHKNEMEKLSAGFLQSLGAEPGTDVTTVIKELKQRNHELSDNVDTLAETLARKQQSLLEALQAVDNIAMEDEKHHALQLSMEVVPLKLANANSNGRKAKMKEKWEELKERRKSFGNKKDHNEEDMGISGLPKPPKRRNSQIGIIFGKSKPHHRPTATFFKRAIGDHSHDNNKLDLASAKNGKELQFVAQQLTNDVGNKTQSIQNLEMANTALMEQMQKMQKQMQDMKVEKHNKQESNHSINDLP